MTPFNREEISRDLSFIDEQFKILSNDDLFVGEKLTYLQNISVLASSISDIIEGELKNQQKKLIKFVSENIKDNSLKISLDLFSDNFGKESLMASVNFSQALAEAICSLLWLKLDSKACFWANDCRWLNFITENVEEEFSNEIWILANIINQSINYKLKEEGDYILITCGTYPPNLQIYTTVGDSNQREILQDRVFFDRNRFDEVSFTKPDNEEDEDWDNFWKENA